MRTQDCNLTAQECFPPTGVCRPEPRVLGSSSRGGGRADCPSSSPYHEDWPGCPCPGTVGEDERCYCGDRTGSCCCCIDRLCVSDGPGSDALPGGRNYTGYNAIEQAWRRQKLQAFGAWHYSVYWRTLGGSGPADTRCSMAMDEAYIAGPNDTPLEAPEGYSGVWKPGAWNSRSGDSDFTNAQDRWGSEQICPSHGVFSVTDVPNSPIKAVRGGILLQFFRVRSGCKHAECVDCCALLMSEFVSRELWAKVACGAPCDGMPSLPNHPASLESVRRAFYEWGGQVRMPFNIKRPRGVAERRNPWIARSLCS